MIRPGPEKHGVWPNLSLDNALLILGVRVMKHEHYMDMNRLSDWSVDQINELLDVCLLLKEMEERDYQDTHREVAPLKMTRDSVKLDTSEMTIDEVIAAMKETIAKKVAP